MLPILNWESLGEADRMAALARAPRDRDGDQELAQTVRQILADVRERGDAALVELARRLDPATARRASLRVDRPEIDEAASRVPRDLETALEYAWSTVHRFHLAGRPEGYSIETVPGVRCSVRYRGIDCVGLYVPGGSAPLPSSALMLTVPARIAECRQIVLCTPPSADGTIDPAIAWIARRAEVDDLFLIGGAQAIAAMAFGTGAVSRVDKIFGPGNAWVTEAKQQVAAGSSGVAIDMPAGPSEVMVLADDSARPEFVSADLLAQMEHGPDSQAILVTDSRRLAERTRDHLFSQAAALARQDIVRKSAVHGRILVCESMSVAVQVANRYAAEHLVIQAEFPRDLADAITAAGSIFLGPWTPEVLGDYCSGTNHVLPTGGFARSTSGLSVADFMKRITVQEATRDGLLTLAPVALALAAQEGLAAHAAAVEIRQQIPEEIAL
jgi:histidinol dehydrogenase